MIEADISPEYLNDYFKLTPGAREEFKRIKSVDFNIFRVLDETNGLEFIPTIAHILSKEDLFSNVPLTFETFLRFITKIKWGYNKVPYHNKTHGADVA